MMIDENNISLIRSKPGFGFFRIGIFRDFSLYILYHFALLASIAN